MALFLILVFSAAFIGLVWVTAVVAFGHRRQSRINERFEEIIDDLRKDTQ